MLNIKEMAPKRRKVIIIAIIVLILIIFFIKILTNTYKTKNIGNNNTNKTLENVEEYISNINSYEATIEVEINSNKNTNKYVIYQSHTANNEDTQKVLEPLNLAGLEMHYKEGTLEIKNTTLNLSKIYNNYPYIENNNLWLNVFINDYKVASSNDIEIQEEQDEIIITINIEKTDKIKYKKLFLDKKTQRPTKLLLQDNGKNNQAIILYKEITIN